MKNEEIDLDADKLFDIPGQGGSPEKRLLVAILERAVLDYVGNDRKEVEQASQWLFGDLSCNVPQAFSFPWVCSELGLPIDRIVHKIRAMPRRGSRRVAPWYFMKSAA